MEAKYIVLFILINIQIIQAADISNQSSKTDNPETIIRNPKEFHDRLLDLKNSNKLCDAEIIVGNERIPVHKVILASSSAYFEKLFTDNESQAEIELKNMDVGIVQSLIEYIYTGIINVSEKNLREIMSSATFLKITPIIEGCEKILEKNMDSSNCISTWKLAKSEHFENLRKKTLDCVRQNYEKISLSPEFLDLGISEILEILDSNISVTSETIVFSSVKKWINHKSVSRKQYFDQLFNFIRFENLPKNILLSESYDLCSENSSHKCHSEILNVLQQNEKKNFESADNSFRDSYSTLMAVGSYNINKSKTFEIFDLRNAKWIKIENFNCDGTDYSTVLSENKLMLIGGRNINHIAVNTVQSYDLNTGTMENLPSMKYARYRLTAIEFKGHVYAIGGYDGNTNFPNVEMWDPVLRIWKELTPMSIARMGCQVGILEEEIYVVGGYNNGKIFSDVESYNPVTDQWQKRASMNEERQVPGVAVVGGYLYAVGGTRENFVDSNTVEKYDPVIDKWTMIHSLNKTRHGMGAANLFGKLVIVGGWSNELEELSTMEMYDDENDKWISMPSLNDTRYMFNMFKIPWRLAKVTLTREIPK